METMLRPAASGQTSQLSLRVADRTLQWLSSDLRTAMVHRLARHAPSRTDAEDAYQVALTTLVARGSHDTRPVEVEPTGALRRQRLLAFLYVVGKRYLFRLQREERLASRWTEKRSLEQVSLPGPGGETYLDGYLVREVLLELSHEDRTLLTLRSIGASCDELAQRLGITPAAVEKRLQRARERFRQQLIARGHDDPTAGVTVGPGRIRH